MAQIEFSLDTPVSPVQLTKLEVRAATITDSGVDVSGYLTDSSNASRGRAVRITRPLSFLTTTERNQLKAIVKRILNDAGEGVA